MITEISIMAILILINGVLAAAEVALLSVNINKIKARAEDGDKKAALIKKTLADPGKFLSTIQIGISLAGLFSGAFAATNFSEPIVTVLVEWGVGLPENVLEQITIVVITATLSYFSLVFGELVPKRIAIKKPDSIAGLLIKPVNVLSVIASPFVKILTASTNTLLKIMGFSEKDDAEEVTEAEIRMMVEVGEESGAIDETERDMINNIFEFDNKTAEDIATHRKDIAALSIDASIDEVLEAALKDRYSRIPVFEDNIDNIIGVIHSRDVFSAVIEANGAIKNKLDLKKILRKPYFVPTSKKTDELFEEMRKNKVHMAIIVDEYGGTAGLVTMEDLIEEIMGNILDEYDEEEKPEIEAIDKTTFVVDGLTSLDTAAEFFEVELPVDDYDTIGGFLIGQIGRIPSENERPEIEFEGLVFKVYKVVDKRIDSVIVCKIS